MIASTHTPHLPHPPRTQLLAGLFNIIVAALNKELLDQYMKSLIQATISSNRQVAVETVVYATTSLVNSYGTNATASELNQTIRTLHSAGESMHWRASTLQAHDLKHPALLATRVVNHSASITRPPPLPNPTPPLASQEPCLRKPTSPSYRPSPSQAPILARPTSTSKTSSHFTPCLLPRTVVRRALCRTTPIS